MTLPRRVVVTGVGCVSAAGASVEALWAAATSGTAGASESPALTDSPVSIACSLPEAALETELDRREQRRLPRAAQMALVAADQAVSHAGLARTLDDDDGIYFGTCFGGAEVAEREMAVMLSDGPHFVSPLVTPYVISSAIPALLARRYGCHGINHCFATACAASGHAIGEAMWAIRTGRLNRALVGGAEAMITPLTVAAFWRVGALSAFEGDPALACRPFDEARTGFVLGEGAAMLILEDRSSALGRGARILAELVGYGCCAEAYHPVDPNPDGSGIARSILAALDDAKLNGDQIDYVNAHGTGTTANDLAEAAGIELALGAASRGVYVSSTKPVTGHLIGGAGAIEAVVTVLAIERQVVPGTIGLSTIDPAIDSSRLEFSAVTSPAVVETAISNSFAIGGQNVTLAFQSHPAEQLTG
jgi:3-oxoacyl-[acyl-carrier-protein] synthase II